MHCLSKVEGNTPDYLAQHCQLVRGRDVHSTSDLKLLVGGHDDDVYDPEDKKEHRLAQALTRGPDAGTEFFELWQDVFVVPVKPARVSRKPDRFTVCSDTFCFSNEHIYAVAQAEARLRAICTYRFITHVMLPVAAPAMQKAPSWLHALLPTDHEIGALPFAGGLTASFFVAPRDEYSGGDVSIVFAQGEAASVQHTAIWQDGDEALANTGLRAVDRAVLYYQHRRDEVPCVSVLGHAYGHSEFAASLIGTRAPDVDAAARQIAATPPAAGDVPQATACALIKVAKAGKTQSVFAADAVAVGYDNPGRTYCFSTIAVPSEKRGRELIESAGTLPCGELHCGGVECDARECGDQAGCSDGPGWNYFHFQKNGCRLAHCRVRRVPGHVVSLVPRSRSAAEQGTFRWRLSPLLFGPLWCLGWVGYVELQSGRI